MLTIPAIESKVSDVSADPLSVEDFERWIRKESRNVHAWGNEDLIAAVMAVEAVLSEYRYAGMSPQNVVAELANAIRPFASVHDMNSARPSEFTLELKPTRTAPSIRFRSAQELCYAEWREASAA